MTTQDLLQMKISYFGNVRYNRAYKTITLLEWLTKYSNINKDKVMRIRNEYNIDKAKAKQMKADLLPCVTITGVFESYRRIDLATSINPIFVIDIDKDDNPNIDNWNELKTKVAKLPYVFLTSFSCSGRGIYALAYYNNELNTEYMFNALQNDFKEMGIIIDKNCKDITRLRFISYDDNMLVRQGDIEQYNKYLVPVSNNTTSDIGTINEDNSFLYRAIYKLITEYDYRANSYGEWLQDAFRLSTFGELGYILFMLLSMKSDKYNEQAAKEKFKEAQRTTRYTKSSLVYYLGKLKEKIGEGWKSQI